VSLCLSNLTLVAYSEDYTDGLYALRFRRIAPPAPAWVLCRPDVDRGAVRGGGVAWQGLKKQLKRLKAAYESASITQKLQQDLISRTMSLDVETTGAGAGAGATATETAPGTGWGGFSSISSAVSASSLPGVGGGGGGGTRAISSARMLRKRLTSSYSLVVGEDVDEVEEKFKASLDSEVCVVRVASS